MYTKTTFYIVDITAFDQPSIKLKRAMKPMFLYRRMTYRLTSNSNYMTWTTYTIKKFSQNLQLRKSSIPISFTTSQIEMFG